jgi:hypothetical protein
MARWSMLVMICQGGALFTICKDDVRDGDEGCLESQTALGPEAVFAFPHAGFLDSDGDHGQHDGAEDADECYFM